MSSSRTDRTIDRIAVVLPPRERFSPEAAGAIGLLAHRLAIHDTQSTTTVIGTATAAPFSDMRFQPVPNMVWPLWDRAARYAAGVARLLQQAPPDLIEIHNKPELIPPLARRFPDIPILLVLHNDPVSMRGIADGARRAAKVAVVSDWVANRLRQAVPDLPQASLLPNCIDLAALPPPPDPRDQLILFAGRMVADKGADIFVQACAAALPALPGWRAEMIGADRFGAHTPQTPFLCRLHDQAAQAGVMMRGYKPHGAVLAAMRQAAIVVVPSRWPEPFGLTALEAMASGAALICSDQGALPDVVGDGARIIAPNSAALTAQILALAGDSCEREALRQAGLRRAGAFDAKDAAARLAGLRQSIIRPGSPGL